MAITKRSVQDYNISPTKGKDNEINWGQVAADFGGQLMEARQRKLDKQEAVKKNFQTSIDKLSDIPETNDLNVQAKLIKASQESMRILQDRYAQVKDGIISTEDFSLFQTNQKADYRTTGQILQNIGGWTQQIKEKIDNDQATNVDLAVYDYLQGYGGLGGHNIVSGKDGRLQIGRLGYKMTKAEAQDAITKIRQGANYQGANKNQQGADISDKDIKKYIEQNSGYSDEFSKDRGDFIGVDELQSLFTYRGDENTIVDVGGEITNQVSVLAEYITTEVNAYDGSTATIFDFRNMPGVEAGKTAYDEVLEDLQNTLTSTPMGIVQVMTEIGGKKIATSLRDMKDKYGDDAKTIDNGGDVILVNMQNGVVSVVSDIDSLKDAANTEIEESMNSQINSKTEQTGPNASLLNYRLNKKVYEDGENEKAGAVTGIGADITAIISGESGTAGAVAEDRIMDMNSRLAGDGVQIQSIKRDGDQIVIKRIIKTDEYGGTRTEEIEIDNTGDLSQKDIGRKIYRAIVPKETLKTLAYEGFLTLLEKQEGFSFVPRRIKDPKDPTKTIPNPDYKGSTSFETADTSVEVYKPYDPNTDGDATSNTAYLFDQIGDGSDNIDKAGPVVQQAFDNGFKDLNINAVVDVNNDWGPVNTITVKFIDPTTNTERTFPYKFQNDQVKLRSEVVRDINLIKKQLSDANSIAPSDKRLKENINLIGQSLSGVNIYSWNYKDQVRFPKGKYTGVIAQEVPWAVVKVNDYLFVDYTKVDVEFNKIS